MHERAKELVGLLSVECENPEDVQAMLKRLFKGTIEQMLEAVMDDIYSSKTFFAIAEHGALVQFTGTNGTPDIVGFVKSLINGSTTTTAGVSNNPNTSFTE